jgi:hypothetical protein
MGMSVPHDAVPLTFCTITLCRGFSGTSNGPSSPHVAVPLTPTNAMAASSLSAKSPTPPAPWQLPPLQFSARTAKPSQAPPVLGCGVPVVGGAPAAPAPATGGPGAGAWPPAPPPPAAGAPALAVGARPPVPPATEVRPFPKVSEIALSKSSLTCGVSPPAHATAAPQTKLEITAPKRRIALSCIISLPWPRISFVQSARGYDTRRARRRGYLSQSVDLVNVLHRRARVAPGR